MLVEYRVGGAGCEGQESRLCECRSHFFEEGCRFFDEGFCCSSFFLEQPRWRGLVLDDIKAMYKNEIKKGFDATNNKRINEMKIEVADLKGQVADVAEPVMKEQFDAVIVNDWVASGSIVPSKSHQAVLVYSL